MALYFYQTAVKISVIVIVNIIDKTSLPNHRKYTNIKKYDRGTKLWI